MARKLLAATVVVVSALAIILVSSYYLGGQAFQNKASPTPTDPPTPTVSTTLQPTPSHISDEEVAEIGEKYMAENYKTDYGFMGVHRVTMSNSTGTWTYPTAQFRVPPSWKESGILVYMMVNPETAEIFRTWTSYSKPMPPAP